MISRESALEGKTIALAVTGSIAAYKSVEVARLCIKAGARVLPLMTASAARFVGPVTLSGICGESVKMDMWDPSFAGELHVSLSAKADIVAIVPATADILARLAHGRADDLVTALSLCAKGPVFAAPAMHPRMWNHPATKANVAEIIRQGKITLVGPVDGAVASGESGIGRMSEPSDIVAAIVKAIAAESNDTSDRECLTSLAGARIVVTAGPTFEDLDPVRFLGNRSSGKMGFAIAEAAASRGADVTLIAGPVSRDTPHGVQRIDIRSALEMRDALWCILKNDLSGIDALIMAAAVADYRPSELSSKKIKKSGENIALEFVRNPDLLAEIGAARKGNKPVLVGFALESSEGLIDYARGKLQSKRVDLIVANDASEAIGGDENRATMVSAEGEETLERMSKPELANAIVDRVAARFSHRIS